MTLQTKLLSDGHEMALSGRADGWSFLDSVIWVSLCFLVMRLAYHPYFFGDEISPLADAVEGGSFWAALREISLYKPRLLFNAIWAYGGVNDWARWAFGAVNALSMSAIGVAAVCLAKRFFSASRWQLWLMLACLLSSRYAAMIYYDYVSGIIETLSFSLFLGAVFFVFNFFRSGQLGPLLYGVALGTAAVLVHERYVAASFGLGCAVCLYGVVASEIKNRWIFSAGGVALAAVPLLVFLALTMFMGSLPSSTGTAGQEVALSGDTLWVFLTYLGNVFLGLNFGKEWFVGALTMSSKSGAIVAGCASVAFFSMWVAYARSLRGRPRELFYCFAIVVIIMAMVAVASLPGIDRQEARWMYPVGTLICLLALVGRSDFVKNGLLAAVLVLNLLHWGSGALDKTANVYVSKTARNLSDGLNNLSPSGRHGLLVGLGSDPWDVGHVSGLDAFADRNFSSGVSLRVFDPAQRESQERWADFLVVKSRVDHDMVSYFSMLSGPAKQVMLDPNSADELARSGAPGIIVGGSSRGWSNWNWSQFKPSSNGHALVGGRSGVDGFVRLDASDLMRAEVVYRARTHAQSSVASTMRLQVNWMASGDLFIGSTIKVVSVGTEWQEFEMSLSPPESAVEGLVYASVHDGEVNEVELSDVLIRPNIMTSLAKADSWVGWKWQGDPSISVSGAILNGTGVHGFIEMPARDVDAGVLIYRAKSMDPTRAAKMRLQVNWSDALGKYLGTSIDVVEVSADVSGYALFASAPKDAVNATIYTGLHDGELGSVAVESLDILKP